MPKTVHRLRALPVWFAGLALATGLAACGQKGPLYLPSPSEPVKTTKPRPAPASAPAQPASDNAPTTPAATASSAHP